MFDSQLSGRWGEAGGWGGGYRLPARGLFFANELQQLNKGCIFFFKDKQAHFVARRRCKNDTAGDMTEGQTQSGSAVDQDHLSESWYVGRSGSG